MGIHYDYKSKRGERAMLKEAKRKAKMARNLALSSYLEAKRIKNVYKISFSDCGSNITNISLLKSKVKTH